MFGTSLIWDNFRAYYFGYYKKFKHKKRFR